MRVKHLRAGIVALGLAAGAMTTTARWSPACLLMERYSVEWYLSVCWYGEPDPPPHSNEG
jgi:hypothetical protein